MAPEQVYQVSPHGLQSFIEASQDYELAPIGLGSMREQAEKLAEYGRYGDIYVVHAAEGETVIPMEVLEANPQIRALLFNQMEEMGLDPQRYVVGDQLNSLNPVTGMPEFFFKSIFKGVKKVVKKVAKIAKKAAPIILPLAAAAFGVPFLGPMFGAGTVGASMLGSGIGSLLGGASLKDSFKSALFAGGTTLLVGGLSSLGQGNTFSSGIQSAFTGKTPIQLPGGGTGYTYAASPWAQGPSGAASAAQMQALGSGDFGSLLPGGLGGGFEQPVFNPAGAPIGNLDAAGNFVGIGAATSLPPTSLSTTTLPTAGTSAGTTIPVTVDNLAGHAAALQKAGEAASAAVNPPGFGSLINPRTVTSLNVAEALKAGGSNLAPTKAVLDMIAADVSPGIMAQSLPVVAGGLGIGALTGAFDAAEPEKVSTEDLAGVIPTQTGQELIDADPAQFLIGAANLDPFASPPDPTQTVVPSIFGQEGGYVDFPRRNGHITGPGGPKDDLVPAMLSNNEFVMPADAVVGAGGPNAMYGLMRNFQMNSRRGAA
jgi:hypothetical protein